MKANPPSTSRPRLRRLGVGAAGALCLMACVLIPGARPASATTHECGDIWCSGADGATRYNYQGNAPQIYIGETGLYNVEFGTTTGPCPGDSNPDHSCFNVAAANDANTRWSNGGSSSNGLGTQFYYFAGGAASPYAQQWGSPYCWGWEQGLKAIDHANNHFSAYLGSAFLYAMDVEQNGTYGWSNQTKASNQKVYDGFRDFIEDQPSADPTNCPSVSRTFSYQVVMYSAPDQWTYSFPSGYTIGNADIWTYQYSQTIEHFPSSFSDGNGNPDHNATWFGGGTHFAWQYYELLNDHDLSTEPLYMPFFNAYLGF